MCGSSLRKITFVLSIQNVWFSQSFTINCPKWVAWCNIGDGTLRGFGEDVTGVTQEASMLIYARLLHSLSLVVLQLSVGYETWPPIGLHHPLWLAGLNIGWDCISHNGLTSGNFHHFQRPLTVFLHSTNSRHLPAVGAVQGNCERVYIFAAQEIFQAQWVYELIIEILRISSLL